MCRAPKYIAIELADNGIICFTQARGVFGHSIQYRLDLRRRAGDDAKDFARRCLLLQSLFELLKQTNVLNGNNRLIREGFEEGDLLFRKGSYFGALNNNYTNG